MNEISLVFDGGQVNHTTEGPKLYKRDGFYWIFCPAGGVAMGWQLAMRARSLYGPYEWRRVMAKGATGFNGSHQGAWVNTPWGEDWFLHFNDKASHGRVVCLQPMAWKGGWPVICRVIYVTVFMKKCHLPFIDTYIRVSDECFLCGKCPCGARFK